MVNKLIYIFSFIILLGACKSDSDVQEEGKEINTEISGTVQNGKDQKIVLEAIGNQGKIVLAETIIDNSGKFDLKTHINGMGLYQITLPSLNKSIPVTLEPNDKIKLVSTLETFEFTPKLSGAKWTDPLNKYMSLFADFSKGQTELMMKTEMPQEEKIKEFFEMRKPLDAFAKNQIDKDPSNPVNIILTTSLMPSMGFENWNGDYLVTLKSMLKAFSEKYPDSPITGNLKLQVEQIEVGYAEYLQMSETSKKLTSSVVPDIQLKDPNGKVRTLSSLRGQVVLVDFWASWCGPCRRENPNVVAAYNKYKNKGFTIFSVSLDDDAEAWKRAIQADGLIWENHVSDLKKWESDLPNKFGFQGIPYTILVGKDGKIVATNLRGEALDKKLQEIL